MLNELKFALGEATKLKRADPERALRIQAHVALAAQASLDSLAPYADALDKRNASNVVKTELKAINKLTKSTSSLQKGGSVAAVKPASNAKPAPKNATIEASANAKPAPKNATIEANVKELAKILVKAEASVGTDAFLSKTTFDSLPIRETLKKAIKSEFQYSQLTTSQEQYVPKVLQGGDFFVKARTGSGKTLGYMIPLAEKVSESSFSAVIVVTSNILGAQTLDVAKKLFKYEKVKISTTDSQKEPWWTPESNILVAAPGRLIKLLDNPAFAAAFAKVSVLVLDEADALIGPGFHEDMKKLFSALEKPRKAQTLMFSATDSAEQKPGEFMPGFSTIDTIGKGQQSNANLTQEYSILPQNLIFHGLHHYLIEARKSPKYKIIVFLPAKKLVTLAAHVFQKFGFPDVLELHGDMDANQKEKVEKKFRESSSLILFASDMAARGVDYPDVTHVVQVGVTSKLSNKHQDYHHRVGRTARQGKTGHSILIVGEDESRKYVPAIIGEVGEGVLKARELTFDQKVFDSILPELDQKLISGAYRGSLGFYNTNKKDLGWTEEALWQAMDDRFIKGLKLLARPVIDAKTLGKMNLKG